MTKLAKFEEAARICGNLSPKFNFGEEYDYKAALYGDLCAYAAEHAEELAMMAREWDFGSVLEEMAFNADTVTGNASGSYFFSSWKAEEALCHNLSLVAEACEELGETPDLERPEEMDVTVRCYMLGEMAEMVAKDIAAVLDCLAGDETEITLADYMPFTITRNSNGDCVFNNKWTEEELGTLAA